MFGLVRYSTRFVEMLHQSGQCSVPAAHLDLYRDIMICMATALAIQNSHYLVAAVQNLHVAHDSGTGSRRDITSTGALIQQAFVADIDTRFMKARELDSLPVICQPFTKLISCRCLRP